ncbi:TetR-like C-terminal domain-containing protein [Nocardioides yefusunii]|uniref:TetR-like C-terminal domain-containing protein n=1 Tax=Nocardioides yefusunii TaxID=2500546 RepID=A0ABW1QXJ7_9ACTN|nr:TetR-like C-terminal domain-containing protein [Nocardioides yefusunii]
MSKLGRPAGPAADTLTTVLTAALELLLTEGGTALTPLRLHQATGVSRSTIYRHWATPTDVLAALIDVAPGVERSTTGDVVADLHAEVDLLCDRLRDRPVGAFLAALVTMAASDPAAVELRTKYVDDLVEPFRVLARTTGRDDLEVADAINAIVAPLVVDSLLLGREAHRDRAHRAVDLYFSAESAESAVAVEADEDASATV